MNDYEVKIFNNVHSAVSSKCARNRVVSTPIKSYTTLPALSLYEMDSRTAVKFQSSTPVENFSRVTYQLDVAAATKAVCRDIFKTADERMISMNFTRISSQYVTYPDNMNVVRYVARYEAIIDSDGNMYRIG